MIINRTQNTNNSRINFGAKPIPPEPRKFLTQTINDFDTFDVIGHREPDKDSYGSVTVIANTIEKMGKKARIILEGGLPSFFKPNENIEIIDPIKNPNIIPSEVIFIADHSESSKSSSFLKGYFEKANPENIVGIDHHNSTNPISKGIYIDSSSKSASELVYDFANSIYPLNQDDFNSLYCGILDDCRKFKTLKIYSENGNTLYKTTKEMPLETKKVIDEIEEKLTPENMKSARKFVDILSHLSPKEQKFRTNLFNKIKFTKNGKLAYIAIPPKNKEWLKLGQDSEVTSAILNDFRIRLLENAHNDDFISKVKGLDKRLGKIEAVTVFYRGPKGQNPTNERYKISIHSKGEQAKIITDSLNKEGFKAGGHVNRAGGRCFLKDWKKFVKTAIKASTQFTDESTPCIERGNIVLKAIKGFVKTVLKV